MKPNAWLALSVFLVVAPLTPTASAGPLPVPIHVNVQVEAPPPDISKLFDYFCSDFTSSHVIYGAEDPVGFEFNPSGADKSATVTIYLAGYDQHSQTIGTGFWTFGFDPEGGC